MGYSDMYRMSVHAVIFDADLRVLLLKATYGDLGWGLPGGAVDPGETVLATLLREGREELGLELAPGPLTGIYYHKRFNSHVLLFRCRLPEKAAITLSSEHSAYAWSPLGTLSPVQKHRIDDCLAYDGMVRTAAF